MDPRWRTVLMVTPYVVLGMLVAFTLGVEWGDWQRLVPTLVLSGTVVVWILVLRDLSLSWRDRPAVVAGFMTGLIALNLVLVLRDSWFGFLTIATFSFAYSIVPWPGELLAVAATATVAGLAQASNLSHDRLGVLETIAFVALNVIVWCGLSWGLRLAQQHQQQVATELERSRLAHEIHDALAQGFAGIVTQLQAADQAPDEAARRRHTEAALALARDGLTEARRSVQALRPTALDAGRLPEALENVARAWSARTGITVRVETRDDARALSTDAEIALLRTAQEALTNIERHAQAHRAQVILRSDAGGTHLEVRDDGRGFDPTDPRVVNGRPEDGGYGLVAMRERIESVSGDLVVESRPGHGTAVLAEVPK